jgi:predicted lipid-binding transport protein (Tim44 family)
MRFVFIARASALIGFAALLSACPKKDADVVPEPATTAAQPTGASDKAGAETPTPAAPAATPAAEPAAAAPAAAAAAAAAAPAAKPKKKDDQGGW